MRPEDFGIGHTLDTVHARFELEFGEDAAAAYRGDNFLKAPLCALADRQNFRLPALPGGVTLIHAIEIASKQCGLVTTRTSADFKDRVVIIHRVLGKQCQSDLLRKFLPAFLQLISLNVRELAHFCVG